MGTRSNLAFEPIKDDVNMHRALTVSCIFRAQCWTHEHRTWYSRFLSITLRKAPCTFPEALNFIRLGAWGWQDKDSPVWVRLASASHEDEAARVIQPGRGISSVKLLERGSYCRVILWGNIPGWCTVETLRSLLFHLPGGHEDGPVAWLRKRSMSVQWPTEAL